MVNKIFITVGLLFLFFGLVSAANDKVVILAMDDFQVWWLEDVQQYIVDLQTDNNIPVTLGVIPAGIEDPWGGDRFEGMVQGWNSNSVVEVAQHGYDHNFYHGGSSYSAQYNNIKRGQDLFKGAGVNAKSFIPPFGSSDDNTVLALRDLGFDTYYNIIDANVNSRDDILVIQDQIHLCRNEDEGYSCRFKNFNELHSDIENKIDKYGVAMILYHMQDFSTWSGGIDMNKGSQIVQLAKDLRDNGYTIMTVQEYHDFLGNNVPNCTIEICDGLDNDCDGLIDEDNVCVVDNDNDGYDSNNDCNDNDFSINPGALEICDSIDNNCNNQIDEGNVCDVDNDHDGYNSSVDCNDNNPNINPGMSDGLCDGVDNNCNLLIDEGYSLVPTSCGVGVCATTGFLTCSLGSLIDTCSPLNSQTEICDQLDNDCDGLIDEDNVCDPICIPTEEVCDGLDNDCDGLIDEGNVCAPVCGDGICSDDESCSSCSADCGNCSYEEQTLRPNRFGTRTGWSNVGCFGKYYEWTCVFEEEVNFANYLRNAGTAKETFQFSDLENVDSSTEIESVTLYYYAAWDRRSTNACFQAMTRSGWRDYDSGNSICVASNWELVSETFSINPATNKAWTVNEVNSLEAGMHATNPNGGAKIAQVYAVVRYNE